jgi:hypothetical protein
MIEKLVFCSRSDRAKEIRCCHVYQERLRRRFSGWITCGDDDAVDFLFCCPTHFVELNKFFVSLMIDEDEDDNSYVTMALTF